MTYHAGDLEALLKAGKLRNTQEVDETLALVRQALTKEAWSVDPSAIRQYQADISLLLDMQRYHRDCDAAEKILPLLPEIIVKMVQ